MTPRRHGRTALALSVGLALTASACAGAGGSGGGGAGAQGSGGKTIDVLMVGNPQMEDVQKLTKEHFTKKTGIKVNFTVLPENELRDKVTQDVATGAGQYDVATVGAYEVPIWAENGWLKEVSSYAKKDDEFDADDLLDPIVESVRGDDGKMYAVPFYGESSFLMYRKDLFDQAGLEMPKRPTWEQVADFAAKLDDPESGTAGICLRGLPGWGEMFAPLTTVVNTFGGTWFDEDWNARVNGPGFTKAVKFYVELLREHGQPGAAQSGYTECLNTFGQGKAAMWYDATAAAASLEDPKVSKVAGKVGYVYAPVKKTEHSGWLFNWSWVIPKTTKQSDAAWEFASWASSKEYEKLVGRELGWSRVPAGKRESTYDIPKYKEAASAYSEVMLQSIRHANPRKPGLHQTPAVGVQYVGIPEFADLGTDVSQDIAAAIVGDTTVQKALDAGQRRAEKVAEKYK